MVLAVRRQPWGAGGWAFPLLTKVTPGIGLAWHAVRGEWWAVVMGLGVAAGIVAVSVLTVPVLWSEWIGLLVANTGADPRIQVIPLPLLVRLPVALVLVVVAARWDRAWLLPIGVMLALPNVWTSSLALLAAVPALWLAQRQAAEPASAKPVSEAVTNSQS